MATLATAPMPQEHTDGPRDPLIGRGVWVAAGIGVLLRVVWVLAFARIPTGFSDPFFYRSYGIAIASGAGYQSMVGDATAYYPPGYPFLLGAIYRLAGMIGIEGFPSWPVGLVQAFWWWLAIVAVGSTARLLFGGRAGVLAALVLACWPNLVAYAGAILSESAFVAAAACAIWGLTVLASRPDRPVRWSWVLVVAAASVAATALRPQFLLVVVVVLGVWALWRVPAVTLAATAAAVLVALTAVAVPWTVRNATALGAFVPVSTNTGDNLCIGAYPGARGGFALAESCQGGSTWYDGPEGEVAQDRFARRAALEFIVEDPWRWIRLVPSKLYFTYVSDDDGLDAVEAYGAEPLEAAGFRSVFVVVANVVYGVVVLFALIGLVVAARGAWRHRDAARAGLVAATGTSLVVPVLFFGDPRFKVSAAPLLAVLAGAGAAALSARLQRVQAGD
jgi:4-amino-4-deoxy-L-arabinose transferase-like glycosyltransferase